jgi:hypothetical protein
MIIAKHMKTIKVVFFILCIGTSAFRALSDPLYSNNFETPYQSCGWTKAGSMWTTDDMAFYSGLGITGSIQTSGGNQYAESIMTVPTLPSDPLTRWYGGFWLSLIPSTEIPGDWSLSFDVRESSGDPLQVRLYLNNGQENVPEYVGWVTPSSGDWNQVTIESGQFGLGLGTDFNSSTTAQLYIFMASHDDSENPLALSNIGTYTLDIDNIVLASIPEPTSVLLFSMGFFMVLCVSRRTYPAA